MVGGEEGAKIQTRHDGVSWLVRVRWSYEVDCPVATIESIGKSNGLFHRLLLEFAHKKYAKYSLGHLPTSTGQDFLIIAHRGVSSDTPENTMGETLTAEGTKLGDEQGERA
jgi:hypothetical protein